MTRFVFLAGLLGLLTVAVYAADVNGAWTAQVPGRQGQTMDTTFMLKAEGDKLTGTVSTQRGERPIENGKISGDDISFSQSLEFGGNKMTILYKGKVVGDEIKFTRQREGGEGQSQEFVAKRKKVT
jgi:hypothetical protein